MAPGMRFPLPRLVGNRPRGETMKRSYFVWVLWLSTAIVVATARDGEAAFLYYDDPFSTVALTSSSSGPGPNEFSFNLVATNTGAAHDIGLVLPIVNVVGSLTPWNQTLGGWAGTVGGIGLLITALLPAGRLPYSEV